MPKAIGGHPAECVEQHPCSACGTPFPCRTAISASRPDYRQRIYKCVPCRSEARIKSRTREYHRDSQRTFRFGITPEQFADMIAAQGGVCAICGTGEPGGRGTWHIDHNHACCPNSTGKTCGACVRGLLCSPCNSGIGFFKDDVEVMRKAINYLTSGN